MRNKVIEDNRLVQVRQNEDGKVSRHGKRVGKDCPMTLEERRVYIK